MNRQDYIYELVGKITEKKAKKKKNGETFWQLAVNIPEKETIKKINVFADSLSNQQIWKEIENSNYHQKEYLFFCKNFMGTYYLENWRILNGKKN